jgi:ParB-like chromosome segregation protein Spo0J
MKNLPQHKIVNTADLIPYARNSRTHSDEQVAQIAASIREFGFLNPIIIDGENGIIAGHGRVLAAQKLKIEQLPCIEASHLTEAQRKAYVITDNKLALNAGWDDELLKVELAELIDLGFDIKLTGFDGDELTNVMFGEELQQMEAEEQSVDAAFEVSVECENESDQERIYNELTAKGYKCRILTM